MSGAEQIARLRRQIILLVVFEAACVLVAGVSIYGYISRHIAWMGGLFAVAMLCGFAAQIAFVVAFARSHKPR